MSDPMTRIGVGIAGLLLVAASGCGLFEPGERIVLDAPREAAGIRGVDLLYDDERALEGARWNSSAAAHFGKGAYAVFDLGKVTPIEASYIQGDNNDQFVIDVSDDGQSFTTLWTAPSVGGSGLRGRFAKNLEGSGRFVRLRAIGGDAYVTATELQLFSAVPSIWPPWIRPRLEATSSIWARLCLLLFGVLASLATLFGGRDASKRRSRALWIATGLAAGMTLYAIPGAWPPDKDLIDATRAIVAAVAGIVVLRLGFRPEQSNKTGLTALLGLMAFVSILTFYNFGHPQFYDQAARKRTYVHSWDMRVYFPVAKYFEELGYDGVYLASVKSYADDVLGGSLDSIQGTELRDLQTYEMRRVSDVNDEIHAIKDRFSPERWEEFKKDMSYFWTSMGRNAYLGSLRDHGGNATPAWLLPAYLMFGSADASESTFLWAAALDPVLLFLFFIVAWRTFGLRAALVCLVAYGATTVYQFGSNWGGSTLRNDWMVLLGLGVCALKSKRWYAAGLLLGWGAMIRAFPVLALLCLAMPTGWKLFEAWRAKRSGAQETGSPWAPLVPLFKVGIGVVLIAGALGAASSATFGWDESWGQWSDKIAMHANKPNVNHFGLRANIGYKADNLWHRLRARGQDPELWGPLTTQTLEDRWWLLSLSMLSYVALAVVACRRVRLSDAAVIGTMMIPVFFYPSNYYLHILFIWPLLLAAWSTRDGDRSWSLIAATVLSACTLKWFGWLIPGNYGQFLFWSGLLLGLIAVLLLLTIMANRRRAIAETA